MNLIFFCFFGFACFALQPFKVR